jgi:hypothetical protein
MDKAAIFEASTVAPGPRDAERVANLQRPGARPVPPPRPKAPPRVAKPGPYGTDSTWPEPKPAWKRWLKRTFVAVVIASIGISIVANVQHEVRVSLERQRHEFLKDPLTFGKLKAGMTRKEVEGILGRGEQATKNDLTVLTKYANQLGSYDSSLETTWKKALMEGRVIRWIEYEAFGSDPSILAAFPDILSLDSKADAFLSLASVPPTHEPENKWVVNKDNFLELNVGMTVKELGDIFGVGEPVSSLPVSNRSWELGWSHAAKDYRVYQWQYRMSYEDLRLIVVAFSVPPSTSTTAKVLALSYRGGKWDEDKGVLSDAK